MHRPPQAKHEVKSKIGDYIRGKISAQSLMHPSRVNTKPINKSRFTLNSSSFNYHMSKTEYQRKARRPPLKDYIEGKVKLSDMISPSKITYIPKEKKYQAETKKFMSDISDDELVIDNNICSTEEPIRIVTHAPENNFSEEWSLANYRDVAPNTETEARNNEITLIPIKNVNGTRKRKLMCKVKVQHNNINNALTYNGSSAAHQQSTTEHIIEIPQELLRETHKIPKFLLDRYNIPCYVTAGNKSLKNRRPLAILNEDYQDEVVASTDEQLDIDADAVESSKNTLQIFSNFDNPPPIGEGENSLTEFGEKTQNSADIENQTAPLEQGDCNNTTTYIFEFYEEDAQPEIETGHAIIEEIIEDNNFNQRYEKENRHKRDMRINPETPCSEKFHFEDYKSNIYFQREIIDLQMGMLKCDKNVMLVERNINQVTASLNMMENVINQEIRPFVINVKTDNQELKLQMRSLQVETQELKCEAQELKVETQELKKNAKYLRKKTVDYDKLIHLIIGQNWKIEELENQLKEQNWKIEDLENQLKKLNQVQIKTIQLQKTLNKNMLRQVASCGEKEIRNFSE